MRIEEIKEGQVLAIRYEDMNVNKTLRVVTVKEVCADHISTWCHDKKAFRHFKYAGILEMLQVQCETPKDIVGVGTTVYIVQENKIIPCKIEEISQDVDGYHYTLTNGSYSFALNNPKYLNTTKTACANEWLKAQGLGELNEC